uniref:Uncharacterized protein n=1 Tax=Cacopsylla melanoneura TaxID=428564 RepID=A0A8D8ZNL2_9HEMI
MNLAGPAELKGFKKGWNFSPLQRCGNVLLIETCFHLPRSVRAHTSENILLDPSPVGLLKNTGNTGSSKRFVEFNFQQTQGVAAGLSQRCRGAHNMYTHLNMYIEIYLRRVFHVPSRKSG